MMSNEIVQFDMEGALNTINYDFPNYTPTKDSLEFFALMRMVSGTDFEFDTPMAHYFLVDVLFGNVSKEQFPYSPEVQQTVSINDKRVAIVASRGLAKSTVVTCFYPIYCAIKGELPNGDKTRFHLLLGASAQGGAKVMSKAVQAMCEDSVFCKNFFEEMSFTETESRFVRAGTGKEKSRGFLVRYLGIGGNIRGNRDNYGERYDHAIMDDVILNTQAAYSDVQMGLLRELIASDLENGLVGGLRGRIFSVATPFRQGDPVVETLVGGGYTPVLLPICEKINVDTTAEEFKGAWPAMHPYEAVIRQYRQSIASNSTKSFNQERMLRIASEEDRMIPDHLIQWYRRSDIQKDLFSYNLYGTSDYTTTGHKGSDLSGQALWAVGSNSDYFLLDLTLKKQELDEQYRETVRMAGYWGRQGRTVEFGVESDGQQLGLIDGLKQRMVQYNEFFTIGRQRGAAHGKEGISSKAVGGNKHWRFRMMLPMFQNKKIWFPEELKDTPDMKELLEELKMTTYDGFGSKHDDGVDLISMMGAMEIMIPAKSTHDKFNLSSNGRGMWGDASYDDSSDLSAYSSYV